MWARIRDDQVEEITNIDPVGRFHKSIQWVECNNDTRTGWKYDGEQCLPPPPEPIDNISARKHSEIDTARDAAINAGFNHKFGDKEDVVQTRQRDRENLTGLAVSAQRHSEKKFHFRAESNNTYEMTSSEIFALADAAQAHVSQQYAKSWRLKAEVDGALAAQDREAIEAISW